MRCILPIALLISCALEWPAMAQQAGEYVVVTAEKAQIRAGSEVLETVTKGLPLRVREVHGEWLSVTHSKAGWIDRNQVLPIDNALDKFKDDVRKSPEDVQTWMALGLLHLGKKNDREAVHAFTEVVRLRPRDPRGYANRAIAWKRKGELDIAIADYNEAIRLNPKSHQTWHNRGNVWLLKGDYEKAISDQQESIALAPENFDGYNALAWIRATCPEESFRDGNQAVENAPKRANYAAAVIGTVWEH